MDYTNVTIYSCLSAKFSILHNRRFFKPWLEILHHMHLFIRLESIPQYNQTVLIIAENYGIDTTCMHTVKDLFKKMRIDLNLQDEIKFLCYATQVFKKPLKYATWIHNIRVNVQEKISEL